MTDSITRCPKCKTSFRVNNDHLNTARGAVRCGSCLNIFNAKDHLVKPKTTPASPQPKKPKIEPEEDFLISDDMHDNNDDGQITDEFEFNDVFDENVFVAKSASTNDINLFERKIKDINDEPEHTEADESWAKALLEAPDDNEPPKTKQKEAKPSKSTHNSPQVSQESKEQDELSSMFRVLEEDTHTETHENPFTFVSDEDHLETPLDDDFYDDDDGDAEYRHHRQTGFLDAIEPEPLELHVDNGSPFWQSSIFWLVLCFLAGLTAMIQLAYFNFDKWSRSSNLRPYYANVCSIFSCDLPLMQDTSKIRIKNMTVIEDPKTPGKLLVDAILINQAKFEQRFPRLTLTFTNINNKILEDIRFSPKDYVGGELAGRTQMPINHPIHFTLEIKHPGQKAMNYQLSIVNTSD